MKKEPIHELLCRSLDGGLTDEQAAVLNEALRRSETLRNEKERLLRIRALLADKTYSFKGGFVDRVMKRIEKERVLIPELLPFNDLFYFFKRVALTGAAAILLLLITLFLSGGSFDLNHLLGIEQVSEEDLITYLLYLQ